MPIQPDLILAHQFPEIRHTYTARDAILYALGAGLGRDPVAPDDLLFLWEENLAVLPTFAVTLCTPGLWLRAPEFGVDFGKLVHAEQAATFHAPLPAATETVGSARVALLADRGPGRGAVVALEREIRDAAKRRTLLRVAADVVPPRRRRVRRTAGAERALDSPRSPTGCARRIRRRSACGAHLPALGRPQSAAHRSGSRWARRLRSADPAWPGELCDRRHRGIARLWPSADPRRCPSMPFLRAWCSRATCSHSRFGGATGRRCFRASSTIVKCSIRE